MEDAAPGHARRFLVVTPNVVVGEDLRDILGGLAGSRVDVHPSLAASWDRGYTAAFFGVRLRDLIGDPRLEPMRRAGTQLVVLNGYAPGHVLERTGLMTLPQPFRSEDVEALLLRMGIAERTEH